jgi:Spy/CpxP family protein refolding chaperone
METKKLFLVIGIAILVINSPFLNAQKEFKAPLSAGERPGKDMMIPNLTEQQKEQMKALRIALMKEVQPIRNEIGELMAHLKTLSTAANPNMAEINKNIDSQSAAINKLMKLRASHQQDVRKILTDEQKLFFDMNFGKAKAGRFPGKSGPGMGNMPGMPMR